MSRLVVDDADPTPTYEQIRRQIVALVDGGALAVGERLPTVRQLAGDLRLAPGTVSRAYKELESAGYVETRRAAGTRVAARASAPRAGGLDEECAAFVARMRAEGYPAAAVLHSIRRALGGNVAEGDASRQGSDTGLSLRVDAVGSIEAVCGVTLGRDLSKG